MSYNKTQTHAQNHPKTVPTLLNKTPNFVHDLFFIYAYKTTFTCISFSTLDLYFSTIEKQKINILLNEEIICQTSSKLIFHSCIQNIFCIHIFLNYWLTFFNYWKTKDKHILNEAIIMSYIILIPICIKSKRTHYT